MERLEFNQIINRETRLNAMQASYLYRMCPLFSKAADILGAQTILLLPCEQDNEYLMMMGFAPHTTFNPLLREDLPIIKKFKDNCLPLDIFKIKRKIELGLTDILGDFLYTYAYPIFMEEELIGVLLCGCILEDTKQIGFQRLLQTTDTILKQGERSLVACSEKPLKHNTGVIITDKFSRIIYSNKIAQHIYYQFGIVNLQGLYTNGQLLKRNIIKESITRDDPYAKEIYTDKLILIRREWPIYEAGNLVLNIITVEDITEICKKDQEIRIKSTVIQEIHHRMKNNLQTVASLLRMQGRRSHSKAVKKALSTAENRILSIGIVHAMLSQESIEKVNVGNVIRCIAEQIGNSMVDEDFKLTWELDFVEFYLSAGKLSNLAMVFNELLLNAIEHGFKERKNGLINCRLKLLPEEFMMIFADNGVGFTQEVLAGKGQNLGLQIINTIVEEQLAGTVQLENLKGAVIKIRCPLEDS